jgi:uncharacterized protein (DUF3084 family)
MQIITRAGDVNRGLRDEIKYTREHYDRLSGHNMWLEGCMEQGRAEIDRLQITINQQGQELGNQATIINQQGQELVNQATIIRQRDRTMAENHASQLQTSSAMEALRPYTEEIKKGLTKPREAQAGGMHAQQYDHEPKYS